MKNVYWFSLFICSLLVLCLWMAGCGAAASSGGGSTSTPSIYYQSAHSPYKIYKMGSDGSGSITIEISAFTGSLEEPALSPEKDKLAFISWEGSVSQVYVCDLDGANLKKVTSSIESSADPCWSSDGTAIVFVRGGKQIIIVDAATTAESPVLTEAISAARPSYYESSKILFMRNAAPKMRIAYYEIGVGPVVDLSSISADAIAPSKDYYTPKVSPDGTKIAFSSTLGSASSQREIWIMNFNGTNPVQLTYRTSTEVANNYDNNRPVWSPDSSAIVFYSNKPGDETTNDIWGMKADGTELTNLTSNEYSDINPSWR